MTNLPAARRRNALLDFPAVDRTRRNHGLEHATITILSQRHRGISLVGRSTPYGFHLYGDVTTAQLDSAVQEALRRMKGGEESLAVHPNCGTNFVTAGLAAAAAAYIGFLGANTAGARRDRLPLVTVLATAALMFAQPLGLELQRHITTSGEMRGMQVTRIDKRQSGRLTAHFVATAG